MSRASPNYWTAESIRTALVPLVEFFGHMPSSRELTRLGRNDLSCAISKHGGFAEWRLRLGAAQGSVRHARGKAGEDHVAALLSKRGLRVDRQRAKSPFDLLVNGWLRAEVKCGIWHSYVTPRGVTCAGYFFSLKAGHEDARDILFLCCENDGIIGDVIVVPAKAARIQMLTFTKHGKYERFRNAFWVLDDLLKDGPIAA